MAKVKIQVESGVGVLVNAGKEFGAGEHEVDESVGEDLVATGLAKLINGKKAKPVKAAEGASGSSEGGAGSSEGGAPNGDGTGL